MESIISFSFPALGYTCSLNPRGRRKYGTLEQLLATKGSPSTVGLPDGTSAPRPDIRVSTKYTSAIEISLDTTIVEGQLQRLLTSGKATWSNTQKYDVIEYGPGGFFKEHRDKKHKSTHYGTLLIFPPATGTLAHTGGELIVDKGRFKFDSSINTQWTFIAFHSELPHECRDVLSGRRVVFKTELYSTMPLTESIEPMWYDICDGHMPVYTNTD